MKLKNVLLTCLSMVLVAALAIGGTVAYLTSEDSDVNVMTKGNVKIAQHEYQRVVNADGTYATDTIDDQYSYVLEAFEQAKPLLPIVGDPSSPEGYAYAGWDETTVRMSQVDSYGGMQVFAGKNAQDKFVTVENTGITDAYVRTLVAIEVGTADAGLIGTSYHMTWTENEIGIIEFDDNKFLLIEFVYNGASSASRHENGVLPAGDTSYPSLAQIYLGSEATNEDCEKLDGNKNGTLDIIVLSQAVQAAGFADAQTALDTAFGDITTINHPWVGETIFADPAVTNPSAISTNGDSHGTLTTSVDNKTVTLTATGTIGWANGGGTYGNWVGFKVTAPAGLNASTVKITRPDGQVRYLENVKDGEVEGNAYAHFYRNVAVDNAAGNSTATYMIDWTNDGVDDLAVVLDFSNATLATE